MHIYVYTLKCLHEASNFVHTSEASPGSALLRHEKSRGREIFRRKPRSYIKGVTVNYFRWLTNSPLCITEDLLRS